MADGHGDPYLILGVERSASRDEIRRAFRRLAMEYHPDRNPNPQAEAYFKEIAAAYNALSGSEKHDDASSSASGASNTKDQSAAAPIVISGRGDGEETISLQEGVWSCQISVSGNSGPSGRGSFGVMLTGRNGGFAPLANVSESDWSSREQISVGGRGAAIRPGAVDIKVSAVGDWSLSFTFLQPYRAASAKSRPPGAGRRDPSVSVSGRGTDVKTLNLKTGVWFCEISVEGNVDAYGVEDHFAVTLSGRNGGYDLLANEIASDWSARKRVAVGRGPFDLGPGLIDVEVEASGRWNINCALQSDSPQASTDRSSPVRLSGSGNDLQTIHLSEGIWFCQVSVADNVDADGDEDHFAVQLIARDGGGELLANDFASDWSARKRVAVSRSLFDLQPGLVDVQVTAAGRWSIDCVLQ